MFLIVFHNFLYFYFWLSANNLLVVKTNLRPGICHHQHWLCCQFKSDICNLFLFSPLSQFFAQFFSTQNCISCDKTDFAKKTAYNATKHILQQRKGKFQISSHLSCGSFWNSSTFGKISHLLCGKSYVCMHICHVLKSEISPHDHFFPAILCRWYWW